MVDAQGTLHQAVALVRAGDKVGGRTLLTALVKEQPDIEHAWLGLFMCAERAAEKKYYLEQALRVTPNNEQARQKLAALIRPAPVQAIPSLIALVPQPEANPVSATRQEPESPRNSRQSETGTERAPAVIHIAGADSWWQRLTPDLRAS